MKIIVFGDTHEQHRKVSVPPSDLLIFTGDFTIMSKRLSMILDFNAWLGELPHLCKLVVPGNHEFFLEADASRRALLSNATVLLDEEITYKKLKIFGSSMTPLYGGAFGKSSPRNRFHHWARIPEDVNVLITHGPPHGILDEAPGTPESLGDPELRTRLRSLLSLKLHCFGHVHGAYGSLIKEGVLFVNCALMGNNGTIDQEPMVLQFDTDF